MMGSGTPCLTVDRARLPNGNHGYLISYDKQIGVKVVLHLSVGGAQTLIDKLIDAMKADDVWKGEL